MRVTILFADGRAKVIGELASFEQQLSAGEFVLISDLSDRLAASGRTADLRDVQLVFEVTAGNGAVTVFTSKVDNGTGDSIFRLE